MCPSYSLGKHDSTTCCSPKPMMQQRVASTTNPKRWLTRLQHRPLRQSGAHPTVVRANARVQRANGRICWARLDIAPIEPSIRVCDFVTTSTRWAEPVCCLCAHPIACGNTIKTACFSPKPMAQQLAASTQASQHGGCHACSTHLTSRVHDAHARCRA